MKNIVLSLFVTILLNGLAFGKVTSATQTGTLDMFTPPGPQALYGSPTILLNASGNGMKYINDKDHVMTGASQSADSIKYVKVPDWNLTTLPAEPNMPFPPYLVGGDLVRVHQENRRLSDYQLTIETDRPSYVYLVMEGRVNGSYVVYTDPNDPNDVDSKYSDPNLLQHPDGVLLDWVSADGWVRMNTGNNATTERPAAPDFVGIDENADGSLQQYGAVYRNITEPNDLDPTNHLITLGPQGLGNMYSVIVFAAPSAADLTKDGTVDIDDMIDFAGQWLGGVGGSNDNLAHRYTFDEGAGTTINDEVGGADGTLFDVDDPNLPGTQTFYQWGTGYLDLLNNTVKDTQRSMLWRGGAYIELPDNMIDNLRNDNGITFEIFYSTTTASPSDDTWKSHYFCFGAGSYDNTGDLFSLQSRSNFRPSPEAPKVDAHIAHWHQQDGYWTQEHLAAPKLAGNTHVAMVVDNDANSVKVYVNGVLKNTIDKSAAPWEMPGLKSTDDTFNDTVNYLGRGYATSEGGYTLARVRYKAFNIWNKALTASQVENRFNYGPDEACIGYTADLDRDCDVDLEDFAELASVWLGSYLD